MTILSIEEIKRLVSMQLGAREVNDDSLLVEDLRAESADLVNLVLVLEERYRISVKEAEIAKIKTPLDVLELVGRHLYGQGGK